MAHWTVDKRIPIALIFALGTQTAAAIWWAAGMASRVEQAEVRVTALEAQKAGERLAVLESKIGDVKNQLDRMEGKLDRLGGPAQAVHP